MWIYCEMLRNCVWLCVELTLKCCENNIILTRHYEYSPLNSGNELAIIISQTLQWSHNERHSVSNYRRLKCLLNRLFRCRSNKTSKLRVTGLCEGNSPGTGEFPEQRASNAEKVFIRWRHHANNVHIYFMNVGGQAPSEDTIQADLWHTVLTLWS